MSIAAKSSINKKNTSRLHKIFLTTIATSLNSLLSIAFTLFYYHFVLNYFGTDWNGFTISVLTLINLLNIVDGGIAAAVAFCLYKPISEGNISKINSVLFTCKKFFRVVALIYMLALILFAFIYPHVLQLKADFWTSDNFTRHTEMLLMTFLIILIGLKDLPGYLYGTKYALFLNSNQNSYVNITFTFLSNLFVYSIIIVFIILQTNGYLNPLFEILKISNHPIGKAFFCFYLIFGFQSFAAFLSAFMRNLYCKHYFPWIKTKEKFALDKDVIKNVKYTFFQKIVSSVSSEIPLLFLAIFIVGGSAITGTFGIYLQIPNGLSALIVILVGGVTASFGDYMNQTSLNKLNKNTEKYLSNYNFTNLLVITTAALGCLIAGNTFLQLIYGSNVISNFNFSNNVNLPFSLSQYQESMTIIALTSIFLFCSNINIWSTILSATGKFKSQLKIANYELIIILIIIPLSLLLTKTFFQHLVALFICLIFIKIFDFFYYLYLSFKNIAFSKFFIKEIIIQYFYFILLLVFIATLINLFFDYSLLHGQFDKYFHYVKPKPESVGKEIIIGYQLNPWITAIILISSASFIPFLTICISLIFYRNYFVELISLYWKHSFAIFFKKLLKKS